MVWIETAALSVAIMLLAVDGSDRRKEDSSKVSELKGE